MVRIAIVLSFILAQGLLGFTQAPTYTGLRLSLNRFDEVKTSKTAYTFSCNVINTGREAVAFSKSSPAPLDLVLELDSIALPSPIKGRKSDIFKSLLQATIDLQPGQTSTKIKLAIPLVQALHDTKSTPTNTNASIIPQKATTAGTKAYQDYETSCPDLVFDTAYIVDQGKGQMTIRYVLRNIGGSTARLLGNTDVEGDNIAINVYFNRATKLTRGALLGDGVFITEGKETQNGLLFPNARLYGEIVVPTERHNKFAPNIILEVDPFTALVECDKTNNTFAILQTID